MTRFAPLIGILAVTIATFAVPLALFALPSLARAQPQAEGQVLAVRCQGGVVIGLQVLVTSPGVSVITWDNSQVCGKSV